MKKWIALLLTACMASACFVSCGEKPPSPPVETTGTVNQKYDEEDSILKSCIGQADENGVYRIPDSITMIGEGAFAGDETLKEVVIGPNVKVIGSGAFRNCESLQKVTIEEGVESIGAYAFYYCTSLDEVVLPSTVTRLEAYTFCGCSELLSLSLTHIKEIGDYAMWYCSSLEEVTLSPELQTIGEWAFAQCNNLADIDLSVCGELSEIRDFAFTDCAMLRSVDIPSGTESIGKMVFYGCTRLTNVAIPSSVSSVDYCAFNYTPWYQEHEDEYLVVGDGVLIKSTVHPMYLDLSGKGIKSIGGGTFRDATLENSAAEYGYKYARELENIVIPEGVTVIGVSAFAGCIGLKTISLPSTLKRVEDNGFNLYVDEASRAKVDIRDCENLEFIGDYAFYGCGGIEEICLPSSVQYVGEYAFAVTAGYDAFFEEASKKEEESDRYLITGDGVLVAACVVDGQTTIHIPEGVKVISGSAFCGWDTAFLPSDTAEFSPSGRSKYNISYKVTDVELPSTLETICAKAFYRMTKVKNLVLPSSLEHIGADAFAFCDGIATISGGSGVKEIADGAFRYCASLRAFQISSGTERLGAGVFAGCSGLTSVRFPRGLANAGEDMFTTECTALREVYLSPSARPRVYLILGEVPQDINVVYYED